MSNKSPRCKKDTELWRGDYREGNDEDGDIAYESKTTGIRFTSSSLSCDVAAVFALGGGTGEADQQTPLRTDGLVPNVFGLQRFIVKADIPFIAGNSSEKEIVLPRHLNISFLKWELIKTGNQHVFLTQVYEITGVQNNATQRIVKMRKMHRCIECGLVK